MAEMTMAGSTEVWVPVATLVLGYSLNLVREWLRDHRKRQREKDAREFKLKARTQARRAAFQRKALDELQQAIQRHARLLNSPPTDSDHQDDWLNALHHARVKIISLATVIGDDALAKTAKNICECSKNLEAWASGWPADSPPDDIEQAENRSSFEALQGEMFVQANRQLLELQCEFA
jgi:hypothetical protein